VVFEPSHPLGVIRDMPNGDANQVFLEGEEALSIDSPRGIDEGWADKIRIAGVAREEGRALRHDKPASLPSLHWPNFSP